MAIGRDEIDLLRRAGLVAGHRHLRALRLLRDDAFWACWARHALLALGLGHLLAGIVFFFAYNWAELATVGKFAAIEAGILAAALVALWRGADRLDGAAALVAASVLTGVLLAVIGQVYQTGADPWQLFALWALLSLPWTLASNNAAHWLVWLAVLHVAIFLAVMERLVSREIVSETLAMTGMSLLPVLVLAARELGVRAGMGWAAARWTRLVPAVAGLVGLGLGAARVLFEADGHSALALVVFAAAIAAVAFVYFRRLPDFAVLAAAIGCAMLFLIAAGGRLLFAWSDFDAPISALVILAVLILWVVGLIAGTARLLGRLRQSMEQSAAAAP